MVRAVRHAALCTASLVAMPWVTRAQQVRPAAAPPVPMTRVVGTVVDSTRKIPLAEAVVQLVSAADPLKARSVVSAADGSFRFDSVPADTYLLGFLHPRQADVGVAPPLYRVDIQSDAPLSVALFIPSVSTIIATRCGAGARDSTMGMLTGTIRSARDGQPLAGAIVRAQWSDLVVSGQSLMTRKPLVRTTADGGGEFALCGLPRNGSVAVRTWSGADTSGVIDVEVSSDRLMRRDFFVGPASRVAGTAPDDSQAAMGGTAHGVVRRTNGAPIRGATVSVVGTPAQAVTSTTGEYVLRGLPLGTYMLEARAIGLLPTRIAADIVADAPPTVDFALEAAGTFLDTVKVRSQISMNADRNGFERRRARGTGYFVDAATLERRQPAYVTDVLRMMPGLQISLGRRGPVVTGSASSGNCFPAFFLDGVPFQVDGSIDNVLPASDLKAVEVYPRSGVAPPEFVQGTGLGSPCAIIVLWTGRR